MTLAFGSKSVNVSVDAENASFSQGYGVYPLCLQITLTPVHLLPILKHFVGPPAGGPHGHQPGVSRSGPRAGAAAAVGPELSAVLRNLLEAKDCAVRAVVTGRPEA